MIQTDLQLQQDLDPLSNRDSLTGIASRHLFDAIYQAEWARACAQGEPLSLIFIDVDYFKQYNNYYGHVQGDQCLQRIAATFAQAAERPRDLCARFGGEVFALVLPATDAQAAGDIARRCRQLLACEQLPHARSDLGGVITASMGVGTILPGADDSLGRFLDLVDRRLYRAKAEGRDRIFDGAAPARA
ncbi:diguanylate cyclase [Massilia niastensis]|uniref:diguanylate cyclase n=1 Tax=Massilia niastensis TaxID=544911 RepID=UPI00037C1669|nr:diguanylate cyclase [Massilia niastensis]